MGNLSRVVILGVGILIMSSCQKHWSFNPEDFDSYPVYTGNDPEMIYTPDFTRFRIWAPTAEEALVKIYREGIGGEPIIIQKMKKDIAGTWIARIDQDLMDHFYTFQIKHKGQWLDETPGIMAKAVGVNGRRAAIIDMKQTNPEDWENISLPPLDNYTDIIIYEIHVRDMTIHPESGVRHRGKYLGLTESGTVNSRGEKTGLDHLKELGITHVHILPVFDFRSIDETRLDENLYNWGYDPQNYNVPEGSYATDPYNPYTRIREFKEMIAAFHRKGIRVIMDVVYNHTGYTENSNFNLLVPGYYYRFNADGSWSNASGCGNETASERPMMRKFIIESLKYWVTEYKIDGFRFDLMGIHDIETMNLISTELHTLNPSIFLYGEGWKAGESPVPDEKLALKRFTWKLDSIAAFCDELRDGVKGSWNRHEEPGFVSGKFDLAESVKFGIAAATYHPQVNYSLVNYSDSAWAAQPYQCINYVSCHDNHTLYDKLKISAPDASKTELMKMHKLADAIVLTSQGVPFLHAGADFLRTKQGVENSYKSPDSINQLDWNRKSIYADVFRYYCDLITLRKSHAAFRMTNSSLIQDNLRFLSVEIPGIIAFELTDYTGSEKWNRLLVMYNANRQQKSMKIPTGNWIEIFNDKGFHPEGFRKITGNRFIISPLSAVVLAENNTF